jgi:mannose-6-phosphate isomerase-like protein (cupin superfamily)
MKSGTPTACWPGVMRPGAELRIQPSNEGMSRAPCCFPTKPGTASGCTSSLAPGYESLSDAHEAGVVEHVTVIDGEMELLIDGKWEKVAKGQSVRFPADRPHG